MHRAARGKHEVCFCPLPCGLCLFVETPVATPPPSPYVLRLSFFPVLFPPLFFAVSSFHVASLPGQNINDQANHPKRTTGQPLDTKDEEEKRVTAASWPSVGSGVDRSGVNACTGQETHSWFCVAWGCAEAAGMVLRCLSMTLRQLPPFVIVTPSAFSGCLVGVAGGEVTIGALRGKSFFAELQDQVDPSS